MCFKMQQHAATCTCSIERQTNLQTNEKSFVKNDKQKQKTEFCSELNRDSFKTKLRIRNTLKRTVRYGKAEVV